MTTRINPPTFNKAKTYERFRQELLALTEITDLSKDKQGIAIALSLPDDDESQIREKDFDQIATDDLTSKFHGEFMSPALFLFEVLKMVKLTRGPLVLYQLPKY